MMHDTYYQTRQASLPLTVVTITTVETLRHHIECGHNISAVMRALTWLEKNQPATKEGCAEMRASFLVPTYNIEFANWLKRKAFNIIIDAINQIQPAYVAISRLEIE